MTFQGLLFAVLWHRMTRSKDLSNSYVEGGLLIAAYCNTFPQEGTVPRELQITENELYREHWNHEKTHFHDHQENYVLLCFQSFLWAKHFFNKGYFYWKSFQKIFKDFCGKLKDFLRISHNFSIFKDFSRPVRTNNQCHNKVVLNSNSSYGDTYLLQLQLIVCSLNIQKFQFSNLIS